MDDEEGDREGLAFNLSFILIGFHPYPGEQAKAVRRERVMDHCVSRLLHVFLPLLAKHCPEGLQGATPLQVHTHPFSRLASQKQ